VLPMRAFIRRNILQVTHATKLIQADTGSPE